MPLVELVRTDASDDVTLATAGALTTALRKRGVLVARRPRLRRQPPADADDVRAHAGARARELGGRDGRGDSAARHADGAVRPAATGRAAGRQPRARDAPCRLPRPVPALADARGLRGRTRRDRRRRPLAGGRRGASPGPCSKRSPTRSRTSSPTGSSPSAADVDTCLLLGAGFPFWLGGITKHLDQKGISQRLLGRPLAELGTPSLEGSSFPTGESAILRLRPAHGIHRRGGPLRRRHGKRAARIARDDHAISVSIGGGRGAQRRCPPRRGMGG